MSDPVPAGLWAKRLHMASRAMVERILRPYDLGSTQWYVMYQLAHHGPTAQREFTGLLQIEKATLSKVVGTLVRKGFVGQTPAAGNQRQRVLALTDAGRARWAELPDPVALIMEVAFGGMDAGDLEQAARLLRTATERLNNYVPEGEQR